MEPEDQRQLATLLDDGDDTQGHGLRRVQLRPEASASAEAAVSGRIRLIVSGLDAEVESHAITFRLPSGEAGEAFRRRLAVGTLAATLVVGDAAALSVTYGGTTPDTAVPTSGELAPQGPAVDSDGEPIQYRPGGVMRPR